MRTSISFVLVIFFAVTAQAQYATGNALVEAMHDKYYHAPCKCYTFSQRNQHYEGDSVVRPSVWHEAVEFPDKFRITFGEKTSGNYVLFRNDSVFRYRNDKMMKADADSNSLLLLLGGMYYRDLSDVNARLRSAGYDPSKISQEKWNGKRVFVVGASAGDSLSNQFWVNADDLVIVRIREKMKSGDRMDMRFEAYRKWCKGHVETNVSFRRNGRLEQVEEYYDLKETPSFILREQK